MGAVKDPFWLVIFRPDGSDLSVASLPHTRRTGESDTDAMQRIIGSPDVLERLRTYWDSVDEIDPDDEFHLYKIGDGQRKSPTIMTVESIRTRFDVDLVSAFDTDG